AAQAGLRAGDVIVAVGGTPVTSRDELSGALVGRSSHAISVIILRDRHKRTLRVPAQPTTVQPVGLNAQWAAWAQAEQQWAQGLARQLRAHPEQWRQLERDAEREQAEGQRLAQQIQQRLRPEMQRYAEQEQAEGQRLARQLRQRLRPEVRREAEREQVERRQMAEQLRRQLGLEMRQLQKELRELQKQYANRQYTGAA
ncbi:MAG: PDZ domain-containing protein, partial [Terriglobales bacterium]